MEIAIRTIQGTTTQIREKERREGVTREEKRCKRREKWL